MGSMRMAMTLVLAVSAAGLVQAQVSKSYPNTESIGRAVDPATPWFRECLRVAQVKMPGPAPALPPSCKAFDYYDKRRQAATSQIEWNGVRACAIAAQDDAVLSMLYANGLGVARNLDIATQYACRAGGAGAEMEGRIAHLQALQHSAPAKAYDQCDDITSGFMMGVCAGIADGQAGKIRINDLAALRRKLAKNQVAAFDRLVAATNAFAKARGSETDLSGTARGMLVVQAEAREQEWLREHLAAFEKGRFPAGPALATVDADLNRAYKAVMARPVTDGNHPDRIPDSTVTRANVRAAQRLWLTYRDAWVRFAALRYPALPADALKAALTQWRTQQLGRL